MLLSKECQKFTRKLLMRCFQNFDFLALNNLLRNYDVLKSKSPCILLKKIQTLIKTKRNRKWKIPYIVLERWILCFGLYKNYKLKVKLCQLELVKLKKRAFFLPFIPFFVSEAFSVFLRHVQKYFVEQNVATTTAGDVKYLLNVSSLYITWSSYLSQTCPKVFMNSLKS